jgi:DNA-directed RNA polymerase specialized sigma24 family protein
METGVSAGDGPNETKDPHVNADAAAPGPTEGISWTDAFTPPPASRKIVPTETQSSDGTAISAADAEDDIARENERDQNERHEDDARLLDCARSDPRALAILRDHLIAYAQPVVEKKIADGDMWREAAKDVGILAPAPDPPAIEHEEIQSLAGEVVTRAFNRFLRHGLHKWDPAGGLALTTWFYRDCLHQFSNAVRAWSTDRRALTPSHPCLLGVDEQSLAQMDYRRVQADQAPLDTEATALSAIRLEDRLREIEKALDRETRRIIEEHVVFGRPLADVAKEMGISRQKAYRMFIRCRNEMRRVWGEEGNAQ